MRRLAKWVKEYRARRSSQAAKDWRYLKKLRRNGVIDKYTT